MTCLDSNATFTYTREVTVNYSMGGVSSDTRQHSVECMRVVQDRFPELTEAEIFGLYDCFFKYPVIADLPDRPANQSVFLRELFARHSFDPDFLQALSWACLEKSDCLSSESPAHSSIDNNNGVLTSEPTFKDWVKGVLREHPLTYRIVAWAYSVVRQGW
jgi:hypothetical protein